MVTQFQFIAEKSFHFFKRISSYFYTEQCSDNITLSNTQTKFLILSQIYSLELFCLRLASVLSKKKTIQRTPIPTFFFKNLHKTSLVNQLMNNYIKSMKKTRLVYLHVIIVQQLMLPLWSSNQGIGRNFC